MGNLVSRLDVTHSTLVRPPFLPKRLCQEKRAVLQEFESFRRAFLLAYENKISKSLRQVFIPDVHLEPTALGYPQQKRFLVAMKQLLRKQSDLQVLPALHGTKAKNIKSILGQGLVIPGHGNTMPVQNGAHHGRGIYTASLHAPWLSARFCDEPRMLVCAVLQTKAVLHAADAQVVKDRDHVVPLFVARGKRLTRRNSRCASSEELMTPTVCVSWLAHLEHLVRCKQQGESAASLTSTGCALGPLLLAGFDSLELLSCGFKQEDFAEVFHICSLAQLKRVACPTRLIACRDGIVKSTWSFGKRCFERSWSAPQMREAGFTAIDMLHSGYRTAEQLRDIGFSDIEVQRATGSRSARSVAPSVLSDLSLSELWELEIPLRTLLSAGWAASDLRLAGFSMADLLDAGCSVADLKSAGCTARDLLILRLQSQTIRWRWLSLDEVAQVFKFVGYGIHDLKVAGFRPCQLKSCGFDAGTLRDAGFPLSDLTIAFKAEELEAGGIRLADLRKSGVGPWLLKRAGYSAMSVADAGYPLQYLSCVGYSSEELESARCRTATASSEDEDLCSEYSLCYNDVDLNDPVEWSLIDMWLAEESKEASRSKTARKAVRKARLAAIKQRQQLRSKEERPCPRRKSHSEKSHQAVQKYIQSVCQDPCREMLGTCRHGSWN
mmetsp:Transcript_36099/g.92059  ORF Transcript_36099/g.92059 Transcript_36099/m.92059 type:complete len:664 (-) Transcript_36099:122-2113(-)